MRRGKCDALEYFLPHTRGGGELPTISRPYVGMTASSENFSKSEFGPLRHGRLSGVHAVHNFTGLYKKKPTLSLQLHHCYVAQIHKVRLPGFSIRKFWLPAAAGVPKIGEFSLDVQHSGLGICNISATYLQQLSEFSRKLTNQRPELRVPMCTTCTLAIF